MDHDGPADWDDPESGYPDSEPGDAGALDGDHGAFPDATGDDHQAGDAYPDGTDPDGTDPDGPDPAGHDTGFDVTAHHGDDLGYSYSDYEQEPPPAADNDALAGHDETDPGFDHDTGGDHDPLPEPVSGAHPDLDLVGDDPQWAGEDPFPPQLDVGEPPEPVDGFPWSDPAVLGEAHDTGADAAATGAPPPDDLLAYDAQEVPAGADPWQALAGSEDPATSSLARWWGPGS